MRESNPKGCNVIAKKETKSANRIWKKILKQKEILIFLSPKLIHWDLSITFWNPHKTFTFIWKNIRKEHDKWDALYIPFYIFFENQILISIFSSWFPKQITFLFMGVHARTNPDRSNLIQSKLNKLAPTQNWGNHFRRLWNLFPQIVLARTCYVLKLPLYYMSI